MPLLFGFLLRCVCLLFGVGGDNNGVLFLLVYNYFVVLEFKPRALYMLGVFMLHEADVQLLS